jgi:orotate phosphoribosyltransferase
MNSYDPMDRPLPLQLALWTDPDVTRARDSRSPDGGGSATRADDSAAVPPAQLAFDFNNRRVDRGSSVLRLLRPPSIEFAPPATGASTLDQSLATRLATAPGLVRPGASRWDGGRTPIHPLSMESAYADPVLLRDLGARGARVARDLGVDVIVGAETAGVPLAAAVSLAGGLPFAFVRKPGYRGHEIDEPPVRGADVAGRRVLLVDDAVSSGAAVERFTAVLAGAGAEVVGVFVLVDMRDVADTVTSVAAAIPTESVSTYLQVLALATDHGLLDPALHRLSVDAIVNRWTEEDPRWDLLPAAA